ncbi:DNA gyrase/topoisomerase IV subunit A [Bifidobacterium actinocoloniiforme DSM 22766]|uniref:DNA topoisomerase (ATP-hydrolyzing) n=1 Tax=Bifidobacterium actinocoloniiforme DSM 22766 TaxID=1437605 RepID=A0A086Z0S8_9BIFI|nr:DNA topoisomerase IV subunit A [Bifidobacterium actinocoloniiforme]AKV55329.1 DNA topoisomerase IV subunit A [Bifidobacterium actinocoloniiforme DSM 22766]KFI40128.1 DNA gyrase/topoisomerase IV subunit A [Bifidobacterium actinocoloniiforme DSM 22766]
MASHRKSNPGYDMRQIKEHIVETPLGEEMSKSFLEYAYSVIYARALPDARDGLKPVQRRIIYQMGQMGLTPDKPYMKSARAVGEVMGKLHPHGDSSIYEAMVRLAQPFAMRLPLVDGHGNFGSLDDGPAASRYTEARLASAALGMNADIDEDTVDFTPNYDNKLKEPTVLPSAIPNLLVNGSSGIAVGMATNMITHNLGEVVAAAKHLMTHPQASLDELMTYLPGPDLPGGGVIVGREGIRQAYESGRGAFVTRSVTHTENVTARKKAIVVTELPFMVGPERVLERISEGVKNHRIEGISGAIDLTDRHNGTRLVIELKSGFDPAKVLAQLFKYTPLEDSFTINNVALVDGRPHTMGLKELLEVWIKHRRQVVHRRSKYRKQRAQERLHLVEGLLLAMIDIDEVIQVIRTSEDADTAKTRLMAVFDLDEVQAKYILELRLRRLTKMSRIELEGERDELKEQLEALELILSSAAELDKVVVDEMDQAVQAWGSPRRTVILDAEPSGDLEPVALQGGSDPKLTQGERTSDLGLATVSAKAASTADPVAMQVKDEPCTLLLSASGLIARSGEGALDLWRARSAADGRADDDQIVSIFVTHTLADYALVTSAGRLVTAPVADLPQVPMTTSLSLAGGVRADELIGGTHSTSPVEGERTVAAIDLSDQRPLGLGTRQGVVKRWNRVSPSTMDSWSIIDLKEGDSLLFAAPAADDDRMVLISSDSCLLTYEAAKVRPQGRTSAGMTGIRLAEGRKVAAFAVVPAGQVSWTYREGENGLTSQSGAVVLTVAGSGEALPGTENGAAKVTPLQMYPVKGRGTGGVRSQRFLKGQDQLILACVGPWPLRASTASGRPVDLPDVDMRRDASGQDLAAPIAYVA